MKQKSFNPIDEIDNDTYPETVKTVEKWIN